MKKTVMFCAGLTMLASSAVWAQPVVSGVSNASSYSSDIAQGSWFAVFGTGMGPASISVYQGALPFPTDLSGTSVTLTPASGGAAVSARLWYTLASQLAGLLPSTAATGVYDVRVTYNGQTSAPKQVNVVASNFGYATQSQNGAGPAQATYGGLDLNRFTTGVLGQYSTRPARPGDSMVLWGTGLGADPASDVSGGSTGDRTAAAQVKVMVGGAEVTPVYAGRSSGSPGLDQINFSVPGSVTPGCFVSIQVSAGGRLSNAGTIAVAPPGQSFCTSGSLTEAQLRKLDQGGTLVTGSLELSKHTLDMLIPGLGRLQKNSEFVQGAFSRAGAAGFATVSVSATQIGACTVYQVSGGASATGGVGGLLDAGPQLSLSGPGAGAAIPRDETMVYSATLYDSGLLGQGGSGSPTLIQGSYSIAGNGGADIAAFTAKIDFPSDLVWTNEDIADPISRSTPLPIHWTGGGTGLVQITGTGLTASTTSASGSLFICTAQASAGAFTVPVSVLQQLPIITNQGADGDGTVGTLAVMAITDTGKGQGLFVAPLKAGGTTDQTFLTYSIGVTKMTGFN